MVLLLQDQITFKTTIQFAPKNTCSKCNEDVIKMNQKKMEQLSILLLEYGVYKTNKKPILSVHDRLLKQSISEVLQALMEDMK